MVALFLKEVTPGVVPKLFSFCTVVLEGTDPSVNGRERVVTRSKTVPERVVLDRGQICV